MKLSVAIVVHRPDPAELAQTLRALDRAAACLRAARADTEVSLHLLENSPAPARLPAGERERLLAACPALWSRQWQSLPANRGFGPAHNIALAQTDSDLHLVLNPDVELAADALLAGVDYLERHPAAVLVSPHIENAAGVQQFLCKRYPSVPVLFLRAFAPGWLQARYQSALAHYEARDLQTGEQPVSGVVIASGCCMLLRTAVMRQLGGFDERYFLYFEDFDLSLRLAPLGDRVWLPSMRAVHHGGHAARKGWRHIRWFAVSGWRFFCRFGWRWQAVSGRV